MSNLAKAGAQFFIELIKHPEFKETVLPFLAKMGADIADQTASRLTERHADTLVPPTDAVIPVRDLCKLCGISEPTFKKYFLSTGKLTLVDPPANADRRQKYVSALAWKDVSKQVPMSVIHPKKVAA